MTASALPTLPPAQLAALLATYDRAIARRRLHFITGIAAFGALLLLAAAGAEVSLATLFAKLGNFTSYFYRILHLDNGKWVWTDVVEWLSGVGKWTILIAETVLISYVGTLAGAVTAFCLNFLAARNVAPRPWLAIVLARGL